MPRDRAHFVRLSTSQLRDTLSAVRDRASRADDMRSALLDAFTEQEILATLHLRGETE